MDDGAPSRSIGRLPRYPLSERLLLGCDFLLLAILFVAPLFMGGRHDVGKVVYVILISGLSLTWVASQWALPASEWATQRAPGLIVGMLAILLVMFQLVPLADDWLRVISPGISQRLAGWGSGELGYGRWSTLSLAPEATRNGLAMCLCYTILFYVLCQRVRNIKDAERLLIWVVGACVFIGALALAQFLFGNGKFLWVYDHPSRDTSEVAKGPFQNENHLGQLMALGIGPACWVAMFVRGRREGKESRQIASEVKSSAKRLLRLILPGLGILILTIATALTYSRGGWLAFTIAFVAAISGLVFYSHRSSRMKILGIAGFILLAAIAAIWTQPNILHRELEDTLLANQLQDLSIARARLWSADWEANQEFPLVGTGVGSHRFVYQSYLQGDHRQEFAYAESSYVHLLLESGWAGIGLVFLGVFVIGRCALNVLASSNPDAKPLMIVTMSGIGASSVQAIFDFVWQIPACFVTLVFLIVVAVRLSSIADAATNRVVARRRLSLEGICILTLGMLAAGWWSLTTMLPEARSAVAWDDYRRLTGADDDLPTDTNPGQTEKKLKLLNQALIFNPSDARLHERLAALHFQNLERAKGSLLAAMLTSQSLTNQKARNEWLVEQFAENAKSFHLAKWHSAVAVSLSPMLGRMYIIQGVLSGIRTGSPERVEQFYQQANLVRPYDPSILLQQGINHMLRGDAKSCYFFWREALKYDVIERHQVAALISQLLPASAVIENLQPDRVSSSRFYKAYQDAGKTADLEALHHYCGERYFEEAIQEQTAKKASQLAGVAANFYLMSGDSAKALDAVLLAAKRTPADYELRLQVANAAFRNGQLDLAYQHARWCSLRDQTDVRAQEIVEKCISQGRTSN